MKPQCNTSADCLRELARVMEQFGIFNTTDAINSCYVKYCGKSSYGMRKLVPDFFTPSDWQFAIAEVEGKPVFPYQEGLYAIGGGKFVPIDSDNRIKLLCDESGNEYHEDELTWNPPKPATVMVELPYEVAEFAAINWARHDHLRLQAVGSSCKTALEKLKS